MAVNLILQAKTELLHNMLEGYHLFTITHRTARLEEIGQLIPDSNALPTVLQLIKTEMGWEELFWTATCNRIILAWYDSTTANTQPAITTILHLLQPQKKENLLQLAQKTQVYHGGDAVRHLFEVTSSMDSLVVGEREIVRQMRESYEKCAKWGLTADHYRLLMKQAIEVSKQVFNETGIGEKALSVVALSYAMLQKKGITPKDHLVLVGAGETNKLLVKFLIKDGYKKVTIFNRTVQKAAVLASYFEEGEAYSLNDLNTYTLPFKALVVCTSSVEPIITDKLFNNLTGNSSNEYTVVDLSVPNNVSKEVANKKNVHFIEIEHLKQIAEENLAHREAARQKGMLLLNEKMNLFRQEWHQRQVEKMLHPMIAEIKQVKSHAIENVFAEKINHLDDTSRAILLDVLDYMEKKCVAIPVKTMKKIANAKSTSKNVAQS